MEVRRAEHSAIDKVDFNNLTFGRVFTDHMISCDYEDGKWGDMVIKPLENLNVHPAMHVFHYGQAVFEGLKAYKTDTGDINLFRIQDNLKRLNRSANRMAIPAIDVNSTLEAIKQWMELDKAWVPNQQQGTLYLRPFLIATSPTLRAIPSLKYKFMLIASPVGFYYAEPIRVKVESRYARAAKGGVGYAKAAGNYGAAFMPTLEAKDDDFDQLVWTDPTDEHNLEELGSANIFIKSGDELITPELHDSILAGITRDTVLKVATDMGMEVIEKAIPKKELLKLLQDGKVDSLFATGTAAAITFIEEIDVDGDLFSLESHKDEKVLNIKKRMEDIKFNRVEDANGWNVII